MSPSSAPAPQASAPRGAEELRPLRHRAGSARPRRRPRLHHQASPDIIFDLGCGWLHSADENSFVEIAGQPRLRDRQDPPAVARAGRSTRRFPRRARRNSSPRSTPSTTAPSKPPSRPTTGRDAAANLLTRARQPLEPDDRCDLDLRQRQRARPGLDSDMDAYEDTEINWRVRRGYGALIAAYGASCPLAFNTQVTLIDHSGKAHPHRDVTRHAHRPARSSSPCRPI